MIHALPGMGADHRMYQGEWLSLPDFVAHDWIEYNGEVTLTDVAESMCTANHISDGDILIGSSLGGMIACEITKLRRIPALCLIGSAIDHNEVSHLLSAMHSVAFMMPWEWLKWTASKIDNQVMQMFANADPDFIRAMSDAIFKWDGLAATQTAIYRIHGKHDWVLPLPGKVDLVVDGGHLIAMTHSRECVEYIAKYLASECQSN